MPTYQGQVSEEEILQLISYIRSLAEEPADETTAEKASDES
jgi:mono/diheme cytochrome c family protein